MKNNNIPKTGFAGLKAHFKDDIISGFSVSLIALPLCLGIALASGVPPLAGIITAIVGGVLASRIGGTFVTISGPAAGLIVITLGAAESMGGAGIESGFAGYPHALGAIVIGGLIMAVFGLLKVGKVGDYFPSAAVHGMLAAIGVIIIIKQVFPAIGAKGPKGEILEVASEIPHYLMHETNLSAIIVTLVALATLIIHPIIKSKIIKMVPAPMWVLIFTIPLAMYLGHENLKMVNLDGGLLGGGGLKLPSFEKIGTSPFWIAVIGVALVSAIESLLSAKAVDSLDPYKRSSNLDKDLIAMGAGSSLAAALGGLPMISEIVRSSANVNNGAKTQWANFSHGLFLLIYVLIGVFIIEMIPVPALAAMLVFTGFRLASPKEFKHMYKIGLMEFEIFVVTLVAVLATDLIIGIVIGILFKYVLILFKGTKINELFKSNLSVEHKGSSKIIYLKGSQIFSNYLSLKKKMDSGVQNYDELILDFSAVNFVDHTVMEHLEDYARLAKQNNKNVHIENVENLHPVSNHPLAARDKNSKAKLKNINIDSRTLELLSFAQSNEFEFQNKIADNEGWDFYTLTIRKKIISIKNIISTRNNNALFSIADIKTQEGAETTTDLESTTVLKISGLSPIPKFYMEKETFVDKIAEVVGARDIDFDTHKKFSNNYVLKGLNENEVRKFFTPEILNFFESNLDYYMVSNGTDLMLHQSHKVLETKEIHELLNKGKGLIKCLNKALVTV
ncbi:MAG: SulP family inorganic anion transporter [Flavobacteriales bacterium]|nr:SulP family inorganic anion transporter [Flavobacteriales bacterium]